MAQQTQINGNRYSFTDVFVQMDGNDIAKGVFKAINYTASQDPGIVQGNQVSISGRTAGYATSTGSFQMLVSEFDDFASDLLFDNPLQSAIMGVDFDIVVSYSVNDVDVRTDVLRGCRITKIDFANQQGNDATMVSCDLSIARIDINGIAANVQ